MILIMVLSALAILLLCGSAHYFRRAPTLQNRLTAAGLAVAAVVMAVTTAAMQPGAMVTDARSQAEAEKIRVDAQVAEVNALSGLLGGPQGYIEYLKAIRKN